MVIRETFSWRLIIIDFIFYLSSQFRPERNKIWARKRMLVLRKRKEKKCVYKNVSIFVFLSLITLYITDRGYEKTTNISRISVCLYRFPYYFRLGYIYFNSKFMVQLVLCFKQRIKKYMNELIFMQRVFLMFKDV